MRARNKYACRVDAPALKQPISWSETVGRRAIIDTRRETHARGIGAKGAVRIQQSGSVRWKIIYQCIVTRTGRLSARGVEL